MATTIETTFLQAQQLQKKKQFAQAWELYQQVLQADHTHLPSVFALGKMLHQNKKYSEAIPYLQNITQVHPLHLEANYLLAMCYLQTNQEEGLSLLKKVIKLTPPKSPQRSEAYYQLAKFYRDNKEEEQAEKHVDRILEQYPNYAKALSLKGQFQQKREENEAAYENFKKAVELMPKNAPANHNFATIANVLGKKKKAMTYYKKAIALNPNWDQPLRDLALLSSMEGQPKEAELLLKKAVKIAPNNPENYRAIAQWYATNGDRRKAIKFYKKTVDFLPDDLNAYKALGSSLAGVGAYQQAIPVLQKVYQLESTAENAVHLASTLIAHQQLDEALPILQAATALDADYLPAIFQSITLRAKLCDWSTRTTDEAAWTKTALQHMAQERTEALPLLDLNFYNVPMDVNLQLNEYSAKKVSERAAYIKKQTQFKHRSRERSRLKIGYISPDFRHHPVGRIVQNIFSAHHRSEVEVYAYSISETSAQDDVQQAIKAGVDHFFELPFASDTEIAQKIHHDGIDILVDLGGFTAYTRPEVLAVQPAPVQAQFLGYPNTMGADYIQYIIADQQLIPESLEQYYTEKVAHVPHAFPGVVPYLNVAPSTRGAEGLPEDAFVLAAFNRPEKYDPLTFTTWINIVNAIPQGILWLGISEAVQQNIRAYSEQHDLDISRVKFSPWADYTTFLKRLQLADLFLDTFNYSAGATAVASIAMCTPVLTVTNQSYTSRLAASVVSGAKQEALICPDLESYQAKAIALGNDREEVNRLQQQLQKTDTLPLFDMDAFTSHLEQAFWEMYRTAFSEKV